MAFRKNAVSSMCEPRNSLQISLTSGVSDKRAIPATKKTHLVTSSAFKASFH